MKNIFLLLFLLLFVTSNAQDKHLEERHFPSDLQNLLNQEYSWKHSFCGIPIELVNLDSLSYLSEDDKEIQREYEVIDIPSAINDLIQPETNLVIISEHHLVINSRKVIYDIVQDLINRDFKRVYVEAIHFIDSTLNERKYPIAKTGYLICEPGFGEIIRMLLQAGIEVLPYEERDEQKSYSTAAVEKHFTEEYKLEELRNKFIYAAKQSLERSTLTLSRRDYSQYKNIMHTFDPKVKSIVICGHAHGMKKDYSGWLPLGYWLSRHKEIRILSIENSSTISQEDAELNRFLQIFEQKEPFVLKNRNQNSYFTERRYDAGLDTYKGNLWDLSILYPRNIFEKSLWDNFGGVKIKSNIDLSSVDINPPFILYTFLESEMDSANPIPTSATFFDSKPESTSIYIRKNGVKIVLWDGSEKLYLE